MESLSKSPDGGDYDVGAASYDGRTDIEYGGNGATYYSGDATDDVGDTTDDVGDATYYSGDANYDFSSTTYDSGLANYDIGDATYDGSDATYDGGYTNDEDGAVEYYDTTQDFDSIPQPKTGIDESLKGLLNCHNPYFYQASIYFCCWLACKVEFGQSRRCNCHWEPGYQFWTDFFSFQEI